MIDFDDMINKCSEIINDNCILPNWKYIIIDEYQDTSITKLNLIKKIINKTNANFLAVGDDFQSIYRFTGCDLNLFLNFNKYFECSKTFKIINTYRNPQELINIAGSFIMKNKKQQKKELLSQKHITDPIIIYETNNYISALKHIINLIKDNNIMILGRNNKDINNYIDNEYKQIDNHTYIYNNITFKYLTIHRSKGLEEDNIIIINTEDNITSIPTKIKNDKLLNYVNNEKDYYPYEEERRLFYVALTRTKNRVYIITPENNKSIFVNELLKNKNIKKINYK
jgi:DNA helicase-4